MRIGIQLQSLRPGAIGGNETYVRQLVRLLPQIDPSVHLVLFCADYGAHTFAGGSNVDVRVLSAEQFAGLDAAQIRRHDLDLWFCPLLVLEPCEPGIPAVVTIPDLQHHTHPKFFSERVLAWRHRHYPASAHRADAVLTYSEFSRRQIIEAFDIPPGRVHAIHLDATPGFSKHSVADDRYLDDVRSRYRLPERFLFYPANSWPHKNHAMLFDALSDGGGVDPSLHLVLTGARVNGDDPHTEAIRERNLGSRVRHLGYVPDEDLPALYALAQAMVFPSLFEGFGLPVVEAMRAGCPVICSQTTALPEVAGAAALYFDPREAHEIARAIEGATPGRRRQLTEAGRQRAQAFDWRRTAQSTLDVMRRVMTPVGARITAGETHPLISIITPSFRQARFVERTLNSVAEQDYPHVEHLVIDGGSDDGTVEILARHKRAFPDRFDYVSEPDGGQAAAINKGIERARGDVIAWINSDDTYQPGALGTVAREFRENPRCDLVYGNADFISDTDERLWAYPTLPRFQWHRLAYECYLCQPTVFWRRTVTDAGHRLDESLHLALDYDFWIRLGRDYRFHFINRHLANSRAYEETKTLSQRQRVFEESFAVVKKHFGWVPFSWALGRAHYHHDGGDAFFHVRRVSFSTYLFAVATVLRENWAAPRHWRQIASDLRPVIMQGVHAVRRSLAPSAHRKFELPDDCLIAELGVEVLDEDHRSGTPIDLWWAGRHLARIAVNGPGKYTWCSALPYKESSGPYRVTMESDLLRVEAARAMAPRPYPVAATDRWLEQHDTFRLPPGWRNVEIRFMLPVDAEGDIEVSFRHGERTIDAWKFRRPGTYRRQLRLPPWVATNGDGTELGFVSNAAIAPDRGRGEPRHLAMRVHEIIDLTPGGTRFKR